MKIYIENLRYKIVVFLLSITYAFFLSNLKIDAFKDRDNYFVYASSSWDILTANLSQSIVSTLSNEPLWLLVNSTLSLFLIPENVVRCLIFFSSFVTAYFLLNVSPKNIILLILILIFPQVIKNYIIHLRQGFALAIFILGWFSVNNNKKILFFLLAPLIHSSFFFIITLLGFSYLISRMRLNYDISIVFNILIGLFFGLNLAYISSFFKVRQAETYDFTADNISGLGFIFWFFVLLTYLIEGRSFIQKNILSINFLVFYLVLYFFIEVSGRIFESVAVFVLMSGIFLTGLRKVLFVSGFIFYLAFSLYLGSWNKWLI